MKQWRGRIILILTGLAVAAALIWAFKPQPVPVDIAAVERGLLEVTVEEDGQTQVRDRYIVSSPLAGQLLRVPWEPGDPVKAGETVLARIVPELSTLLDIRTKVRAEAQIEAAKAAVQQAQATRQQAEAELQLARSELERLDQLHARKAATQRELDDAVTLVRIRESALDAAKWAYQVAEHELELAQATLLPPQADSFANATQPFVIRSPVDGRVFRVFQESTTTVTPDMPLLEVGDPHLLEVTVDLLSDDAARVEPGDEARLTGWGGQTLHGMVRVVEPSGFTKVSALGVDEQRVNVILDFTSPPEQWQNLGDAYRVDAAIIIWKDDAALKVPTSALFRHKGQWAVFVAKNNTAELRLIEIDHRTPYEAQVTAGLTAGEQVVLYPSDQLRDGVTIQVREDD